MRVRLNAFVLAGAVAAGTVVPAATAPQDPPQAPPVFRTNVDLIRVDVSVTGNGDAPIADLKASDFELKEDGDVQRIETLQYVALNGQRTSDTGESLTIRSREHAALEAARDDVRVFAIFLDDYHVDKDQRITIRVREALRDYVKQFGPNDLIAVMDPLTPLSHLTFTRARDEVLMRMNKFEGRRGEVMPVKSELEEAQLTQRNLWELRGAVTLSALESLVTYLGGVREGRKSVLFVSQGPVMGQNFANEGRVRAVLEAANRGNVTIHAFDPRPLGSVRVGGVDVLARLASETGGRSIANSNVPTERLSQTIADASAYYLIGYVPERSVNDGKFRRIEVRLKGKKGRVLARRGYWAAREEERNPVAPPPPDAGLVAALAEVADPAMGRPVDLWVGASRGDAEHTALTVVWEPRVVPGSAPKASPAQLEIEPVEGGRRAPQTPAKPLAMAVTVAPLQAAAFVLPPETRVALKLTVKDADGALIDRWEHALTVPSFAGRATAFGTPRFLRARTALDVRAMEAGRDPVPSAARRFRPTDRVVVETEYYAADAAPVSAQLLNAAGRKLVDLPVPPVTDGKLRVVLPLSSLAPATYVLKLEAGTGALAVSERVAFRIVP